MQPTRRVVITGVGLRTALGDTPNDLFDALLEKQTAVRPRPQWATFEDFHTLVAAPVDGFDPQQIPRKYRRSMGRVAQFAVAASVDAVRAAGLEGETSENQRIGVVIGSTLGSSAAEEAFWRHIHDNHSARGLKATHFFQVMPHTCATNVAMTLRIRGEALATNAACASATQALGVALDRIRHGRADVVLAGGADELHESAAMTFDLMGGASRGFNDRPDQTPRPFDRDRDGVVVGEGAGILVLEERQHALARDAPILAEVLGYGGTSDAMNMASPAAEGMEAVVRLALEDAGCAPEAIDYVNAHATGTTVGDAAEAEALFRVFGGGVPVSSAKGNLGHTMGACGGIEAIACIEAMLRSAIPPTRNLVLPDVAGIALPTEPLAKSLARVLSTNFAFGGINTAVVLAHPDLARES